MSRERGIGLVGAGRFGAFCVDAFRDLPGARVVAVMDSDHDRAATVAPPGAAVYGDYDALLADPSVDIVHIGTPPFLHGPMARRAAEHGKHVFVEKPLATTLADAQAALDASMLDLVELSIDFVLRHHPPHGLALELTRSGALGNLQHFALENLASSEALPADHWFWDPAASGGIQVEHGVHFFDLCLALVGSEPDAVAGTAQRRPDGRTDRVAALLGFGDQATASFFHAFNRTAATERTTIRLDFERGHLTIDGWIPVRLELVLEVDAAGIASLRRVLGDAIRTRTAVVDGASSYTVAATVTAPDRQEQYRLAVRAGMTNLVDAIDGRRPLEVTATDGFRSLKVALRVSP